MSIVFIFDSRSDTFKFMEFTVCFISSIFCNLVLMVFKSSKRSFAHGDGGGPGVTYVWERGLHQRVLEEVFEE